MIRTVLVVVISLTSLFVGIKLKNYYKRRARLWKELYDFAVFFKEEITFRKTLVDDVIVKFGLSKELEAIRLKKLDGLPFNEDEIVMISDFFDSLGRFGLTLEIENVERYIDKIRERCKDSEKNNEEKGKNSVKLSALIAIGIFLVLI